MEFLQVSSSHQKFGYFLRSRSRGRSCAVLTLVLMFLLGAPAKAAGNQNGPALSISPRSVSFGNVLVGSNNSSTITLTNTGSAAMEISSATLTGTGFSMSGLVTPLTIEPGVATTFTVSFDPTATGFEFGSISLTSSSVKTPAKISLTGTGTLAQMTVVPANVNFGNVSLGLTNTQPLTITNSGTSNLNITKTTAPGGSFGLTSPALPLLLAPGKSATFTVSFDPAAVGAQSSSVVIYSNAVGSPITVPVSGSGTASVNQLSSSSSSLNFGSDAIGTTTSQNVTLTNSGTVGVTVSQINASPSTFQMSGISLPFTLNPGTTATFALSFTPSAAGSATGSASVISTAANSPLSISLSGTGTSPSSSSVVLDWAASSSTVAGYYVYSGQTSGGPYTKVNSTAVVNTSYTDSAVTAGQTYYFVVTAVSSSGVESAYSNQVSAVIP